LLKYLCTWLEVEFLVLDVHGGTTEDDIIEIFKQADELRTGVRTTHETVLLSETCKPVYVFLDEVNTCSHMGLICEIITMRSIHGRLEISI
jgi:E3 ubiquitin-protein ligase RNF213